MLVTRSWLQKEVVPAVTDRCVHGEWFLCHRFAVDMRVSGSAIQKKKKPYLLPPRQKYSKQISYFPLPPAKINRNSDPLSLQCLYPSQPPHLPSSSSYFTLSP